MSDFIFFPALGLLEGKARPCPAMVYIPILARPLSAKEHMRRPLTAQTRVSERHTHKQAQTTYTSMYDVPPAKVRTSFQIYDSPKRSRRSTPRPPEDGIPRELQKIADFCRQRGLETKDIEHFLKRDKRPRRPQSHMTRTRMQESCMDCSSARVLPESQRENHKSS